ncbi:MAG: HAD hydrolase family protein [Phycisphaerales bacterium]|nr:HAD hydrolase family protein [Phycisphaerales bacterium]
MSPPPPPEDRSRSSEDRKKRAAGVTLLVLDVDGVLTDGSILLDEAGRELKRFNVRDGFGIKLWQRAGLHLALVTGRGGPALAARARELAIEHVREGVGDKAAAIRELAQGLGVAMESVGVMGDDWPDLPAMDVSGYAMCPGDADARVLARSDWISTRPGGHGAVREAIEHLLSARGGLPEGPVDTRGLRSA